MNRHPADLYPMRVNPFNFSKGDVVKKVITDSVKTPYVGIVTAIVPSTNKIEVQWPHSTGIEDPWDLIKVNPVIEPPVVHEDKAYKTYQNELSHKYFEKIQPNKVLKEYVNEKIKPILLHAADLYNEGKSKSAAFKCLVKEHDNKRIIKEALDKVFYDEVSLKVTAKVSKDIGEERVLLASLTGNTEKGFCLKHSSFKKKERLNFDNLKEALALYKSYKDTILGLKKSYDPKELVAKVHKKMKSSKE